MSSETTWKNSSLNPPIKEAMVNKDPESINYTELTPTFLPEYLIPKQSMQKTNVKLKNKANNPKKIPLFEDLYDPFILDNSEYDGEGGLLQEGFNLSNKKLSSSDAELLASGTKTSAAFKQMQINAARNLGTGDTTKKDLEALKNKNKDKIKELQNQLLEYKKAAFDYSKDINAKPPIQTPADRTAESKKATASSKESITNSVNQLSYSSKLMFSKLKNTFSLGSEKLKKFIIDAKYEYRRFVVNTSQALTQNHATKTEIDTFSSEIIKVTTVLLSWLILYNWYYVMFFLEPREQYKLNLTYYEENSSFAYGLLGPPLRAVETLDWVLLQIIPIIKKYITSKVVIFFIMAIVFLHMVRGGFAEKITNDFFNAVHNKFTPTLLCISVVLFILVYGSLWWWGVKNYKPDPALQQPEPWWQKSLIAGIVYFVLFCFYIISIIMIGAPIGMFAICGFFFFYSFFAIIMYNGFNLGSTFTAVAENISNISELNKENDENGCDPEKRTWVAYIYNFIKKTVRYAYVYMFELFMLFILINGINTYRVGYSIPFAEKATMKNINSLGGAVNSAFQHLYTWLIIINVVLIVLIGVLMRIKYDNIHSVLNLRKATETLQKLKLTPGLK